MTGRGSIERAKKKRSGKRDKAMGLMVSWLINSE